MLVTMVASVAGCKPENDPNNEGELLVGVYTDKVTDISYTSAKCRCSVGCVSDSYAISEFGVCWNTSPNPTVDNPHVFNTDIGGSGSFDFTITELEPGTEYHVRAYAKCGSQYYYGDDKVFNTPEMEVLPPYDVHWIETEITQTSMVFHVVSIVIRDPSIEEVGLCWSRGEHLPTLDDSYCTFENLSGSFDITVSGLEPGKVYYFRDFARSGSVCYYPEDYSYCILYTEGSGGVYNGNYEYVDMGLPSGTLWATCNVGSDTPEGYGDYFAWAETQPKEVYDWNTYKYCHDGNPRQLTKYVSQKLWAYNNHIDNLVSLEPEDDAATVNWGSEWRTPSENQWWELFANTTATQTIQNGTVGVLLSAPNGNSLFLPYTGYRDHTYNGTTSHNGQFFCNWTRIRSNPSTTQDNVAFVFNNFYEFDNPVFRFTYSEIARMWGFCVRAVRAPQNN